MNYTKHYDLLINKAKNRILPSDSPQEIHHIIPRCLGGTNEDKNLVALTLSEHYVAHQLLVKIYPNNSKILYACQMMTNGKNGSKRNNKLYNWIRRKISLLMSKRITIDGIIYSSIMVASKIFNISGDTVRYRCRSHKFPNWNYTDYPVIKKIGIRTVNKISCDGILFTSTVQAAEYFNIHKDVVSGRCKSSKFPEWFIIGREDIKTTKRNKRKSRQRVQCDELQFDSIYDAAEYFGLTINGITDRFRSSNFTNWNFIDNPITKLNKRIIMSVICENKEYASTVEAGKAYGMTKQGIIYRCNAKSFPDWYFKTIPD